MLELIERAWRLVATALCFTIFGLGGVVLPCVIYPPLILLVRHREQRRSLIRSIIHRSFQAFVALMKALGVVSYEVRGRERLQRRGLLVLANHPSLIDVVFLMSFIKQADCIVKAGLLRNPFTRGPVAAAGFVVNDSGEQLIEDCIASVHSGSNLIIFPEGTRTPLSGAGRLQRGAANVAIRGQIDITPVRIRSSEPLLTKGSSWWRVPARRPHFTISIDTDIAISDYRPQPGHEALAVRQLTDHLMVQLLGDPSLANPGTRDQGTDYFSPDARRHTT